MNSKIKKQAHVEADWSASKTVQAILLHNLNYLEAWQETARTWENISGVHQTRVAFRRMRSALTTFRLVVPKKISREWSGQMRDLASRLGPARDLDVFIEEALADIGDKLGMPGREKLEQLARRSRGSAYQDVVSTLDSAEFARFKQEFRDWCENLSWEQVYQKQKRRKLLEGGTVHFARKVLDRQERRVLEAGAHVDKHDAEAMHRLRIECKKLRYATEFFAPVFTGMDEFIGHMKGLQNLLGVMHDISVMRHLFDEMLEGEKDTEVLEYAGGIIGWRTRYYYDLLEGFEDRWNEFVGAKHPWWKKSARPASGTS